MPDPPASDGAPHERLSADEWSRLRDALEGAIDVSESKRREWLAAELGDDPAIVDHALELLLLDDDGPATRTPLERGLPDAGLAVGPWVTRRLLGTGGMGAVYLASRADGAFERLVALKLIRPHLGSKEVVARFRRERQVQANLHHPGIARMLDGGAAEDGSPYIVMEYVDGLRVDRYCDEYRLTVRERVELFRRVVEAVAYAHEHRIVHRDIKPSNILVGTDGQPKLLDFGIAKGLDPDRSVSEHDVTRDAHGFVTPAYASPEQLRGLPTNAATDVYSLGVLLYQLLVGRSPLDLDGLSAADIERRVARDEPPPPSENIADAAPESRCTTTRGLRGGVRGDLDRIVLYCLRKEPQRRYASVTALGDDLDRYLTGRPVEARPDTAVYRALKFVERNRVPVGVAVLAILVLASGLVYALGQNRELVHANQSIAAQKSIADARLSSLRSLRRSVVSQFGTLFSDVPGALGSSKQVLGAIAENLDGELEVAEGDARLLYEIGHTYKMIGEVHFSARSRHLGEPERARAFFEKGLGALLRSHELAPDNKRVIYTIGESLDGLGAVHIASRRHDDAIACHERTLELVAEFPLEEQLSNDGLVGASSLALDSLGRISLSLGRLDRAAAYLERLSQHWRDYEELHPETAALLGPQAVLPLPHLATIALERGQPERALEYVREAEPVMREIIGTHPGRTVVDRTMVILLRRKGAALEALGDGEAEDSYRESLALAEEAVAADPEDARGRRDVIASSILLGEYLARADRDREANEVLADALDAALRELERPESTPIIGQTAIAETAIAELCIEARDFLRANELIGSAIGRLQAHAESEPLHYDWRGFLVRSLIASAALHIAQIDSLADAAPADRRREIERARDALDRAAVIAQRDHDAGLGGIGPREDLETIAALRAACDERD